MKLVIGVTGASGIIYTQRLLDTLAQTSHEVHLLISNYARAVIAQEGGLRVPPSVTEHNIKSMNAPFASGSNAADAMAIIPCSMGTVGRIAHGYSEDVLFRTADVMLKEKKRLVIVPRETPLSLVHIRNFELLLLAGAILLPANPSFYSLPKSIEELADTVVGRVLDHMGVENKVMPRWQAEQD